MAESEELFSTQEFEPNYLHSLASESKNGHSLEQMELIEPVEESPPKETKTKTKLTELPLTRIRSIMKMDPDIHIMSQEAVYLIAKATELFIDSFAKETYKHTAKAKRKTVQRRDVDAAIENVDVLYFLEGTLD